MNNFLAALFIILLAGCTSLNVARTQVRQTGKEVAAEALDTDLWVMCRATPVGAVIDRFGASPDQWAAYGTLCEDFRRGTPPLPPD